MSSGAIDDSSMTGVSSSSACMFVNYIDRDINKDWDLQELPAPSLLCLKLIPLPPVILLISSHLCQCLVIDLLVLHSPLVSILQRVLPFLRSEGFC